MGNSGSSLPYKAVGDEAVPYHGIVNWEMRQGVSKTAATPGAGGGGGDGDTGVDWDGAIGEGQVSIFCFYLANAPEQAVAAARNCVTKLRTLRHPFIVSFLDASGADAGGGPTGASGGGGAGGGADGKILLITERVTPLSQWLIEVGANAVAAANSASGGRGGKNDADDPATRHAVSVIDEVVWGLYCISAALQFLHAGGLVHGGLNVDAIFVGPGGDWKLGAAELLFNADREEMNFRNAEALLDAKYRSPERRAADWAALRDGAVGAVDMFAFGQVIDEIVARLRDIGLVDLARGARHASVSGMLTDPDQLNNITRRLTRNQARQRLTAAQFLKCPMFSSETVTMLAALNELGLQEPPEVEQYLQDLLAKCSTLSSGILVHKVAPALRQLMRMALRDFPSQREGSRRRIVCLFPVFAAIYSRMSQEEFQQSSESMVMALFRCNDRAVRMVMLQGLGSYAKLISPQALNRHLFDAILAGFVDGNARMRELTLMSMVHVVDNLEDKHLNDKMMRMLSKLHNDTDPSIRTNTTIFLGKIAKQLKPATRAKALPAAFTKALRDNFPHARMASLRAISACLQYFDNDVIALRILPALAPLLMDDGPGIREQAFSCTDKIMTILRAAHEERSKMQAAEALRQKEQAAIEEQQRERERRANENVQQQQQQQLQTPLSAQHNRHGMSGMSLSGNAAATGGIPGRSGAAAAAASAVGGTAGGSGGGSGGSGLGAGGWMLNTLEKAMASTVGADGWGDEDDGDLVGADGVSDADGDGTTFDDALEGPPADDAKDGWAEDDDLFADIDDDGSTSTSTHHNASAASSASRSDSVGGMSLSLSGAGKPPSGGVESAEDLAISLGLTMGRAPAAASDSTTASRSNTTSGRTSLAGSGGSKLALGGSGGATSGSRLAMPTASAAATRSTSVSSTASSAAGGAAGSGGGSGSSSSNSNSSAAAQPNGKKPKLKGAVRKLSMDDEDDWDDF